MGDENEETSREKSRDDWLNRLAVELQKIELFPEFWAHESEDEPPTWVQNVGMEVGRVAFPIAKLRGGKVLTPGLVGGILGHQCAYAVWTLEFLSEEICKAETNEPGKVVLAEAEVPLVESAAASIAKWYCGLRRLAKRALCSSVDQTYEDMTEFLLAFAMGFARKPKGNKAANIGSTTFEIYVFLLLHWRRVERFKSVRELHSILRKVMGEFRTGELKRVEKICQRIDLRYGKPGRPRKPK